MYAVLDVETTGLNKSGDRIIELAVITLDENGNKEQEWCSLINPGRDTGSGLVRRVHQIYPKDVEKAPFFNDFAGIIAEILAGRAIIAHNARFDLGMLSEEYARLGVKVPDITQICTAELARDCGFPSWRLENCCTDLGIEMEGMHHALADARATWCLSRELFDFSHDRLKNEISGQLQLMDPWPEIPVVPSEPIMRPILPPTRSIKRTKKHADASAKPVNEKNTAPQIETFSVDRETSESKYLSAVEWVLEDREISPEQQKALEDLRSELNLTDEQIREVHLTFMRGLAGSMWADGEISGHEEYDWNVVGKSLLMSDDDIQYALKNPVGLDLVNPDYKLWPEARVVFTGEMSVPRSEWKNRAKAAGLKVTSAVSSKTNFLVVPFGETGSGKSLKARKLGVTVFSEQRFLRMIRHFELD